MPKLLSKNTMISAIHPMLGGGCIPFFLFPFHMELMGWGWINKRWVWCVLGWEKKSENTAKKRKINEEMSVLGIHYVGQMEEGSLMRFLVDQLTDGQLEWAPLPATYDAVVLGDPQGAGKTFHIHSGKREYFQRLKEQFPGEAAAIDEFQRLVKV